MPGTGLTPNYSEVYTLVISFSANHCIQKWSFSFDLIITDVCIFFILLVCRHFVVQNGWMKKNVLEEEDFWELACENSHFSSLLIVGCFVRRKVCNSVTEILYWWRKVCLESGQKRWLVNRVVTFFQLLFMNDRTTKDRRPQRSNINTMNL